MTNYENVRVDSYSVKQSGPKRVLDVVSIGRFDSFAKIGSNEVYGFSMRRQAVLDAWTLDEPGAEQRVVVRPISESDVALGVRARFIFDIKKSVPYEGDLKLLFESLQKRIDTARGRECPDFNDKDVKPELVECLCRLFE